MDIFNEWIISRKRVALDYLLIAGMILGGLIVIVGLVSFAANLGSFLLLAIVGVGFLVFKGIQSTNIEYEYNVTNSELEIDKIIARRRRKRVTSVHSRTFEYFAPLTAENQSMFDGTDITKKIDAFSSLSSERICFAIYHKNNDKIRITFEPTEKMIDDFSRFVPRSAFKRK